MNNSKETLTKLALIKYLVFEGNQKIKLPQPIRSLAIINFHDALELFLVLLAAQCNISFAPKRNFLDYIVNIDKELERSGKEKLHGTAFLDQINRRRVDMKHYGITTDESYPEEAYIQVTDFLSVNIRRFFLTDWDNISLVDLVHDKEVKNHLQKARIVFNTGDQQGTAVELAIAFSCLIRNYESTKKNRFGRSPFFFGGDMTFLSSFFLRQDEGFGRKMGEFVDKTRESLESIQEAVKIISFGIDYRKYVKFSVLTPTVVWNMANTPRAHVGRQSELTKDEFEFSEAFVIESALKIQEFDFITNQQ